MAPAFSITVQAGYQERQQRKNTVEHVNDYQTAGVVDRVEHQMPECGAGSNKCADVGDPLSSCYLGICGDYADRGKTLKPTRHRQGMLCFTANKFAQSRHYYEPKESVQTVVRVPPYREREFKAPSPLRRRMWDQAVTNPVLHRLLSRR